MQSFSTKLLHKAILDKLSSWVKYINGEYGPPRYSIRTETDLTGKDGKESFKIIISQGIITKKDIRNEATEDGVWEFPLLTLTFEDQLALREVVEYHLTGSNRTLEYADPELYKKLFAIVDQAAKHGLKDTLRAIDMAMERLKELDTQ